VRWFTLLGPIVGSKVCGIHFGLIAFFSKIKITQDIAASKLQCIQKRKLFRPKGFNFEKNIHYCLISSGNEKLMKFLWNI